MREYTKDIHAKAILKMLTVKYPCSSCPAIFAPSVLYRSNRENICNICRDFVNVKASFCPCLSLGGSKAIKHTWLALEAGGYLDDMPEGG